jgi:di/tricarboxylate transporter
MLPVGQSELPVLPPEKEDAMTVEIALVLAILVAAVVLFVTEWLRMDVTALLVLASLPVLGLISPVQALSGFSNAAVVTVWAMFIISGGLTRTGVANIVGQQVMRLAGSGELRLVAVIMITAATMSAFMNNVGVAAMLLPVVISIARNTRRPPSRLLMPLAYGSLLGGLTTLIGTPPNILVSDALRDYGLPPFRLFDFTPIGGSIMLAGIAFVAMASRYVLPARDPKEETAQRHRDFRDLYELSERLFVLHLHSGNPLAGRTLADSRLGAALRLNVLAVIRNGRLHPAPGPDTVLLPDDRLLVQGRPDRPIEFRERRLVTIESDSLHVEEVIAHRIEMAAARVAEASSFAGKTIYQADIRRKLGINVLAVRRNGITTHTGLQDIVLQPGDVLLLQGPRERWESLTASADIDSIQPVAIHEAAEDFRLQESFFALGIPDGSSLAGKSLEQSWLGDGFDLTVMGILRNDKECFMPKPDEILHAGDILVVKGDMESMLVLRGLQDLGIESQQHPALSDLESELVGMSEIMLSPETTLEGKTLRELHFREKYGLTVLAIWRRGRAYRSGLRDTALRFGDFILLYGPREKLKVLSREPDFLVLSETEREPLRLDKASVSVGIMAVILLPVLMGWLPISIAAVTGALLMVLTRCLTMEEAYRYIEWPAVFLIAGMLPLGIAMEQTGAAVFLADKVISLVGGFGPRAVIAGIFILTSIATQIIPTAALVVLMAPIAINTAIDLGISPLTLMMTVAMAASASFSSPVSHPANVLVMGPGGYRFADYLKLGLPLTLLILVLVVALVPIFWPLHP